MLRQRIAPGVAAITLTVAIAACQPWASPGSATGGEMALQVQWPLRTQAIPPETAVVAVGVFRDGHLIPNGAYQVGIVGRGAGSIVYRGLADGDYRVVAAAYDKTARPLAGGSGSGTIHLQTAVRSQVRLALTAGDPAADLSPYQPDIKRYLDGLQPEPSPTATTPPPSAAPTAGANAPQPPTAQTGTQSAAPSSAPTTSSGGSGDSNPTTSTVTFTGGFH
jgi:hypothetical protein